MRVLTAAVHASAISLLVAGAVSAAAAARTSPAAAHASDPYGQHLTLTVARLTPQVRVGRITAFRIRTRGAVIDGAKGLSFGIWAGDGRPGTGSIGSTTGGCGASPAPAPARPVKVDQASTYKVTYRRPGRYRFTVSENGTSGCGGLVVTRSIVVVVSP